MELPQQVVSLAPSKRLHELGVKQESIFQWRVNKEGENASLEPRDWVVKEWDWFSYIAAFTVAELGEILPVRVQSGRRKSLPGRFYCTWTNGMRGSHHVKADTEADARAGLLIYLIENKLVMP